MSDSLPLGPLQSRFVDQVWAIRESSLQAYLGDMAAGRLERLKERTLEHSQAYERQGSIAVFRVQGVMVPKASWYDEVSTSDLTAALNAAARDDEIRAGVMLINSPGGMALGQLELSAAAAAFAKAKTLTAHIEGCCCSAGYWLASQSSSIYCGPRDDIGSIGVRSLIYDWSKYFDEAGVEAISSATGPFKDLGVMGKAISEPQRDFLKSRVDYLMGDFKSAVMAGRDFNETQFATVADGRYWFGEQAVDLGLVDGVQSKEQTFAGVESAITSTVVSTRSISMADQATKTDEPKAVTTAELKKAFPSSTADWREEQIEAGATMADAAVAYAQFQEAEAEKARQERDEAKAEAEKAKEDAAKATEGSSNSEPAKSNRGVPAGKQDPASDENADAPLDYRAMARTMSKEKEISYREACRRVQKEHGDEARAAFRGKPLGDQ